MVLPVQYVGDQHVFLQHDGARSIRWRTVRMSNMIFSKSLMMTDLCWRAACGICDVLPVRIVWYCVLQVEVVDLILRVIRLVYRQTGGI